MNTNYDPIAEQYQRSKQQPAGKDHGGPGHWDDFLTHPPATFIECRK